MPSYAMSCCYDMTGRHPQERGAEGPQGPLARHLQRQRLRPRQPRNAHQERSLVHQLQVTNANTTHYSTYHTLHYTTLHYTHHPSNTLYQYVL